MAVEFNEIDGTLIVVPLGEIDHHESKNIRYEIDERITEVLPEKIVFDLARTSFMDSSGLGLILGRYNKAKVLGADFELVNPGDKIMRILTMSGIDKIIEIKGVEK